MAKGKPDPNWQQKVLKWQASGKSCLAWCKESQISYTTFLKWKRRFENSHQRVHSSLPPSTEFIELKDQPLPNSGLGSGVTLEYQGIKISLQSGFNSIVLKQCLVCLGGISC